jgi:hypothetical protein
VGVLRTVLEQFAPALLRPNAELKRVCGPINWVSSLFAEAASKAQITDSRFPPDPLLPRTNPDILVVHWGNIIEQYYLQHLAVSCRKAEGELDTAVALLHDSLSQIEQVVEKMAASQERILPENCSLKAEVQFLTTEVVFLRNGLTSANSKLAAMQDGNDPIISYHCRTPPGALDKVVSISMAI